MASQARSPSISAATSTKGMVSHSGNPTGWFLVGFPTKEPPSKNSIHIFQTWPSPLEPQTHSQMETASPKPARERQERPVSRLILRNRHRWRSEVFATQEVKAWLFQQLQKCHAFEQESQWVSIPSPHDSHPNPKFHKRFWCHTQNRIVKNRFFH